MRNLSRICPVCSQTPLAFYKQLCSTCKKTRQRARCTAWNKANPQKTKEMAKRNYLQNKAKRQAYNKRPEVIEHRKSWNRVSPGKKVTDTKKQAFRRGIEYALPNELAKDLVTDNCFYCGEPPTPFNGIDRVDNSKGYIEDNVVTACKYCNAGKLTRSRADFEAWILRAAKHLTKFSPYCKLAECA